MKSLLLFLSLFFIAPFAQAQEMSVKQWDEDLTYLKTKLEERHANLYHTISQDSFKNEILELKKLSGEVEEKELIIRISELIAKVGDAHTFLNPGNQEKWGFPILPLSLKYFDDGLFISGVDSVQSNIIGSHILGINDHNIEEIISKVSQVGYNENEYTRKISVERFMVYPDVLRRFGFSQKNELTKLTLKKGDQILTTELKAIPRNEINWTYFENTLKNPPITFYQNDSLYWTYFESQNDLLYVQLNKIREDETHSFNDLRNTIVQIIEDQTPRKLVLDMRRNVGGNSQLTYPLLYALMHFEKASADNQIFIVTGRLTLSASIVLIDEIQKFCNPIIMGEPTGAAPNLYGENSYYLTLPNSKLSVSYSSEWFQAAGPFVSTPWIAPDIFIPPNSLNYFNAEEAILDEIRDWQELKKFPSEKIYSLAINGKHEEAIKMYDEFKDDQRNMFRDTRNQVRRLANKLGEFKLDTVGLTFHKLNLEEYPDCAICWVNTAGYLEDMKRIDEAKEAYRSTKTALAKDTFINEYLKHYIEDYVNSKE